MRERCQTGERRGRGYVKVKKVGRDPSRGVVAKVDTFQAEFYITILCHSHEPLSLVHTNPLHISHVQLIPLFIIIMKGNNAISSNDDFYILIPFVLEAFPVRMDRLIFSCSFSYPRKRDKNLVFSEG